MITMSMLEKFTKRIEGLREQNKQKTELPHYNIIQQEYSQSLSPSHQEFQKSDSGQDVAPAPQKPQFSNAESESSSIKQNQNQQNSGRFQIDIDEENDLLKKIKNKLALTKNSEIKQSASTPNSQNNSISIKKQRSSKSIQNLPPKQSSDQSQKNSKMHEQSEQKKLSEAENSKKKRALVAEVLKETASMQPEQKMNYYRNVTKAENLSSTHELKIWIDSLEMVFKVQQELKKLQEKPNEKVISKKFAQRFIKYVQNNVGEKRYKFRRICSIVLKELNLTTQKVDSWLNRFMNQNSKYLKGIDLSQYGNSRKKIDISQKKQTIDHEPGKVKKLSNINGKQAEKKEPEKKQNSTRNYKNAMKAVKIEEKRQNSISEPSSTSSQDSQSQSEDSFKQDQCQSFQEQNKKNTKQRKINDKRKQKLKQQQKQKQKQKPISPKSKKEKKVPEHERKVQPKNCAKTINEKPQMYQIPDDQIPIVNSVKTTKKFVVPTVTPPQKVFAPSTTYPENFARKLSAKLDIAFSQVFDSILKQKCEEYCVEEQALKQMYEKYGGYFLKRDQKLQQEIKYVAPISSPSPLAIPTPITPRQNGINRNNLNFQANSNSNGQLIKPMTESWTQGSKSIQNIGNGQEVNGDRIDRKKKVSPPPMPVHFPTSIEVEQPDKERINKNSARIPEESKIPEQKSRVSLYEILGQRLSQFLRFNGGCSQTAIKNQALRIAKTAPQLMGKMRQDLVENWVNSFLQKNKHKINLIPKEPSQGVYQQIPKMKLLTPPQVQQVQQPQQNPPKMMMKPTLNPGYQNEARFIPQPIQPIQQLQRPGPVSPIRNDMPRNFHIAPPKRNPETKGNGVSTHYQYQFQNGQN